MLGKGGIGHTLRKYAAKRRAEEMPDVRAVRRLRTVDGISYEAHDVPLTPMEVEERLKWLHTSDTGVPTVPKPTYMRTDREALLTPVLSWAGRGPVPCSLDDYGGVIEQEPSPDNHNYDQPASPTEPLADLRRCALVEMISLESPPHLKPTCAGVNCTSDALFRCDDCDGGDMYCSACLLITHVSLASLGLVFRMGHDGAPCPHEDVDLGPQLLIILDINGVHEARIGWCRCAGAATHASQLLSRRLFPATMRRPVTAFTFRCMQLFQMHNHVARTTPWDFCGAQTRLTDNVVPTKLKDIYKPFNQAQRQWRVVRAWKRAGVLDVDAPRTKGSLAVACVSCPIPGVNIPENWRDDPDADLIYAAFIGGDGCMHFSRNNKGGGEATDPSLFGDDAFYAPNNDYKDFCPTRGGAPDDTSDITCRGLRAGNAARATNSHNKPCTGVVSISCIRSGAFLRSGTVDLAKGERFVNFDFALVQVLIFLMSLGLTCFVISYDIACKYYIHFLERIAHESWPLMTTEEHSSLAAAAVVWLVPKFHLAAHIEGCADKFSFNWTKNVGRTCGEMVESNWAGLTLLANSTREMGFGHRRDTIVDAMNAWNWRKATGEASRIVDAYRSAKKILAKKRRTVSELEQAMGPTLVQKLREKSVQLNGAQFRPRVIASPTRLSMLKKIQEEEANEQRASRAQYRSEQAPRSAKLSGSVGINMGLDIELRQQNLRVKIAEHKTPTEAQNQDLLEAKRKMSKSLDVWFLNLADFLPPDALQEPLSAETRPDREALRLPSDFPVDCHNRLGLEELAQVERRLQLGQACDALQKLRTMLGLKSFLVRNKYDLPGGQSILTRAIGEINKANRQVEKWKEVYRRTWNALLRLGPKSMNQEEQDVFGRLRDLQDSDCVMLSAWMDHHRYWTEQGQSKEHKDAAKGGGQRPLPWIWKFEFEFTNSSSSKVIEAVEGWTEEVIWVEWSHVHASFYRFNEEVRLLRAESVRVGKTFRHYEQIWRTRVEQRLARDGGTESADRFTRGSIAHAWRQADIFRNLAEGAEKHFQVVEAD